MPRKKTALPDPDKVLALLEEAGDELDVSKLASELLAAFGGASGLAKKCLEFYVSEKTNVTSKGRMLEAVMRLLSFATPKDGDPFAGIPNARTEDLERLLGRFVGQQPGASQ